MEYKIVFAKFLTVRIEADSKKEAEDYGAVMDTDEIENRGIPDSSGDGYTIWDVCETQ